MAGTTYRFKTKFWGHAPGDPVPANRLDEIKKIAPDVIYLDKGKGEENKAAESEEDKSIGTSPRDK